VRLQTGPTGALVNTITYDAFGKVLSETAPATGDRYAYTGRERDSYTGLQYNRARWYDPASGRWNSEDPLDFAAGDANLYRYVGNFATGATDPSGKYWITKDEQTMLNLHAWLRENGINANGMTAKSGRGVLWIDPADYDAFEKLIRNSFDEAAAKEIIKAAKNQRHLQDNGDSITETSPGKTLFGTSENEEMEEFWQQQEKAAREALIKEWKADHPGKSLPVRYIPPAITGPEGSGSRNRAPEIDLDALRDWKKEKLRTSKLSEKQKQEVLERDKRRSIPIQRRSDEQYAKDLAERKLEQRAENLVKSGVVDDLGRARLMILAEDSTGLMKLFWWFGAAAHPGSPGWAVIAAGGAAYARPLNPPPFGPAYLPPGSIVPIRPRNEGYFEPRDFPPNSTGPNYPPGATSPWRPPSPSQREPETRGPKLSLNAQDLLNGKNIRVKSIKEADDLLREALPRAKKVTGTGPGQSGPPDWRKFKGKDPNGMYHKDYHFDPETGRIYGHGEGNPHGDAKHINIKLPDGRKVTIIIEPN
jgi:RHS repeat-associated protein